MISALAACSVLLSGFAVFLAYRAHVHSKSAFKRSALTAGRYQRMLSVVEGQRLSKDEVAALSSKVSAFSAQLTETNQKLEGLRSPLAKLTRR